jgi:type IV pilus assembly protein PilV
MEKHVRTSFVLVAHNDKGFALLEILVAALLLTVGFLGMVGLSTSVMRANSYSRRVTTATILAQEKIEEIRGLGYPGLPTANVTTVEDYDTIDGYSLFKRTVSTDVTHGTADGLKKASVAVYWGGDIHRVVLKTLIGE